jgi:hypothetical protein
LLAVVTIDAIADNTLFEESGAESNGAGAHFFVGKTAGSALLRRGLVKFDVAAAVPSGATINSVTLRLNMSRTIVGSRDISLHRLTQDWGEGTSVAGGEEGGGAPATSNDATWLYRFYNPAQPSSSPMWTTAGGTFAAESARTTVAGNGAYQWTSSAMASDVQGWLNAPTNQFGWLLRQVDEGTSTTAKRFDTSENSSPANRPQLTIDYSVGPPNQAPTLNAIPDPAAILEDAAQQTVNLAGISAGPGETQTLTVTATSDTPGLIPNPTVTYTSPNATGSLAYTPVANQSGSAVITVTVRDNGGTTGGGTDTVTRTFTVNVTAVNDAPTLNAITDPVAILEDALQQTVNLAGIAAGLGESQTLTVTATSDNPGLIPNPTVTYTSSNTTGSLAYTPIANQSGTAVITVTVMDNGGTANGGANFATRTFTVNVTPVNDAPTLNAIADPAAILEDAAQQTVNVGGIGAGGGESQVLTITATSSNPGLIPNPTVTYTSPNVTGSLAYTPVANQSGSAIITVTATDDGGTANNGVNSFVRTFTVNVTPVNDAPTLNAIADPAAILEDSTQQAVNLAGISAGPGETQTLTVTATSSNPGLIPNPSVNYTSPNATGSLAYSPIANQSGSAVITVTVTDNGGTANGGVNSFVRTFTVNVTPVNDAPTLNAIVDPAAVLEDAAQQTVNLSGISAGGGESQTLSVTATSDNPGLIPNPTVTYTSPNATGSLAYTPIANQSGTALITVTVMDNGGTANGGANLVTRTFTVNVTPVNDAPALNAIADPAAILEDAAQQAVSLAGIAAGPVESQTLTVTATSSNPGLIPNPTVTYTSPNDTGSLAYSPIANQSGTALITVTVMDNGGTANGGANFVARAFTVNVTPVNDAPTLAAIPDPAPILQDAGQQIVGLAGISAGSNESQTLTVTATSNNPGLVPNPAVTYSSPNATGSLAYAPAAGQLGTAVITVTVTDNGGTADGGVNFISRTFSVNITPVNQAPTLSAIPDPAPILEDAAQQTVSLAGISAGPGETQTLTVTATSGNPGLIPDPTVTYTSPNATGSLAYTPVANQSGSALITVTVRDDGGTAGAGVDTIVRTFTVNVTAVNDAPTLNAIADPAAILEDASQQTVNLGGIGAGGGESQSLTVTATSNNPGLISNPTVTYTSPNATGSLAYTPVSNQSGSAVITVTITDNGGTADGGVNSFVRTFTVNVTPVNDPPTLAAIADPLAILEDAAQQTVNLSGIGAGGGESQTLSVTATSNNPGLIPNPAVTYTSPNAIGSLAYTPLAHQSGSAVITVTVMDNGGTANGGANLVTRTFTVNVAPVNDAPTLNAIADPPAILEDAPQQIVNLAGIAAGPGESQTLSVTAISDNPGLAPNPTVIYSSPSATGSLSYTPVANQSGSAVITVTVTDNGGTAGGGINSFVHTFTVNVTPVNDAPTLSAIPNPPAILQDAGQQTVNLAGIGAGGGESQTLTVIATSSNPGLIPNPSVTYASPNATGSLAYAPVPNQSGSAIITVTVADNGGTTSGGIDTVVRTFTVVVTPPIDIIPPTADILDVSPDPRNSPVASVSIVFNEPVTGVDLADFVLTRNGQPVAMAGAALSGAGTSYTLTLGAITGPAGSHVLRLAAAGSGIADGAGNFLTTDAQDSWATANPAQNAVNRFDVNNDTAVDLLDILALINQLSLLGTATPSFGFPGPPYYDVNNDVSIDILDVLALVNQLSSQGAPEGERERADVVFHDLGTTSAADADAGLELWLATESPYGRRKRR